MTFKVLITDPISEEGISPLRQSKEVHIVIQTNWNTEELKQNIIDFDALIVRSQTQVTREVIECAPNLKIIGRAGVGVDNIDVEAATEKGIIVVNAPNANTNSAAEHTMAMLMALSRKIPQAYLALKEKQWDRKKYVGVEIKNKTLGIIGLGRIGAEVAYRAKGQRMHVVAYDPFLTKEQAEKMGIEYGNLDDVLRKADFITVHTPLVKETKHLLNHDAFEKMKTGVQLINCARGGIIDEDALYEAILSKKVAGAALDVMEEEPFYHHRLLDLPEVILTPHIGASTVEAQENVAIDVSHDILHFINGESVRNPVNMPSLNNEILRKVEPFFYLAEKLGEFLIYLTDDVIEEIVISYHGDVIEHELSPLTRRITKGILKRHLGTHVNEVNALLLADKRGIRIQENKSYTKQGFSNLISVQTSTKSGVKSVAGTLLDGLGPRIVKVDHYRVDVTPKGHIIVIQHTDQPGVIGRMGSILAKHDVNIATMQVDRADIGGEAIMMLTVDKHIEGKVLIELLALNDIHDVKTIDL
ncbi:phosphoglycerate dehydrogenase [Ornithinibacillus halotolerans]|uniref:D-3-phosphoglycerate dehydrogenase n=1 Tax=Ornithinibacillus halotolerans TaxID=1274357 RepID=A0A916S5M8_9BACI|nr:phosphoglycerate dehydrogenase [Ornithinibacillus halotolerans]GGA85318.1 D-3-phosphoglycerate dehydrogenase [Ornithinibacillus halotolerans]